MKFDEFVTVIILTIFLAAMLVLSGCRGPIGPQGPQGSQGAPGPQGLPGLDGLQGMPGTSFIGEVIDPCPTLAAQHPEVLFFISGTYYAVYASGSKIHLTPLLENIQYQTTDGRSCKFKVLNGAVVPQ